MALPDVLVKEEEQGRERGESERQTRLLPIVTYARTHARTYLRTHTRAQAVNDEARTVQERH